MTTLGQDVRYGVRSIRKSPGFAALAVAALALGIGANTAVFSAVHAVLLEPLPFRDPSRLVMIFDVQPEVPQAPASMPIYVDWRDKNPVSTAPRVGRRFTAAEDPLGGPRATWWVAHEIPTEGPRKARAMPTEEAVTEPENPRTRT